MTGNDQRGFTLLEILIALVIFSVVMAVAVKMFMAQQSSFTKVDQRSRMMTNARGAMYLIESQIRLMGFSPGRELGDKEALDPDQGCRAWSGNLVFRRQHPNDLSTTSTISIGLYKADDDEGGGRDGFADSNVGATGLIVQGGRVADDIEAIGFAYAFDADGDGGIDLSAGNNIIWAVDDDRDGYLDTRLDTNDDGMINELDTPGGLALSPKIAIHKIRAVKVWLLVRSTEPLRGGSMDTRTFYVAGRPYKPNDRYGHTLCATTIRCRNLGLL
ncbi:MAG: prepilin-type N-terminal cleavage/methylation domain-containing protein [Desulfosudaceae bacterium]